MRILGYPQKPGYKKPNKVKGKEEAAQKGHTKVTATQSQAICPLLCSLCRVCCLILQYCKALQLPILATCQLTEVAQKIVYFLIGHISREAPDQYLVAIMELALSMFQAFPDLFRIQGQQLLFRRSGLGGPRSFLFCHRLRVEQRPALANSQLGSAEDWVR
ncbi:hypothetical protein U0070_010169 [Myodes glareolus]|uniref:Uncharacterized protein n=1 Tax=Myodes glareolus TaxID=447135 RepID=A0AAW0H1T0_MYOGA